MRACTSRTGTSWGMKVGHEEAMSMAKPALTMRRTPHKVAHVHGAVLAGKAAAHMEGFHRRRSTFQLPKCPESVHMSCSPVLCLRAQHGANEGGAHVEVFVEEAPLRLLPAARGPPAPSHAPPPMAPIPPPAFVPDYGLPLVPTAGRPAANRKPTLAALAETDRARPHVAGATRAPGAREPQHWQPGSG